VEFKRLIIKLSGESLSGNKNSGIDFEVLSKIAEVIKICSKETQIGIILGGGNFWRGARIKSECVAHIFSKSQSRLQSDKIGMMATVINSLVFSEILKEKGVKTKIQSAIYMPQIAEFYKPEKCLDYLNDGYTIVFACGIGLPFFSTDTSAALRASELQADVIFKATNTDGVYNNDPKIDLNAIKYEIVTFSEILSKNIGIIDASAASICRDSGIPLLVFDIKKPENIILALNGKKVGTWIKKNH
jgi:uridylate kinase